MPTILRVTSPPPKPASPLKPWLGPAAALLAFLVPTGLALDANLEARRARATAETANVLAERSLGQQQAFMTVEVDALPRPSGAALTIVNHGGGVGRVINFRLCRDGQPLDMDELWDQIPDGLQRHLVVEPVNGQPYLAAGAQLALIRYVNLVSDYPPKWLPPAVKKALNRLSGRLTYAPLGEAQEAEKAGLRETEFPAPGACPPG